MSSEQPNLVLIGLRGSGKSTLGALLAEALGREFVDLDDSTARVLGCQRAGDAIAQHGMDAFRTAERTALDNELKHSDRVLALGGGTPTAAGCKELLSSDGCRVFYLKASPACLRERIETADNTDRPSLTGASVLDEIDTVYQERDPLYTKIAESIVHVDGTTEDSLLAVLVSLANAGV